MKFLANFVSAFLGGLFVEFIRAFWNHDVSSIVGFIAALGLVSILRIAIYQSGE